MTTLIFGGLSTNGGVDATVRDAFQMGYKTLVLKDGIASFNADAHQHSLEFLGKVSEIISCQELISRLKALK